MTKQQIGVVGLAVMEKIWRSILSQRYTVSVFNRSKKNGRHDGGSGKNIHPTYTIEIVNSWKNPEDLLMVRQ